MAMVINNGQFIRHLMKKLAGMLPIEQKIRTNEWLGCLYG
jgi:hypothetical protein